MLVADSRARSDTVRAEPRARAAQRPPRRTAPRARF
jgi:hypothetical protein